MRHKDLLVIATASLLFASCGSSDKEAETTTTPASTGANTASQQVSPGTTPANNSTTISAPTITTGSTPSTTATSSSALNPAHGQPGHRCDIAVGAPLDSKPASAASTAPTITTSPATTVSAPVVTQSKPAVSTSSTATKTAAGMNPAHGQPGHRCDIAVGAPLDSKPIQASIQQPTTTTTPAPAPAVLPYTPVSNSPQPAASPVAKGMNPAHGQPGHRCDIAVGAPLDSKPAQPTVVQQPAASSDNPATKPKN